MKKTKKSSPEINYSDVFKKIKELARNIRGSYSLEAASKGKKSKKTGTKIITTDSLLNLIHLIEDFVSPETPNFEGKPLLHYPLVELSLCYLNCLHDKKYFMFKIRILKLLRKLSEKLKLQIPIDEFEMSLFGVLKEKTNNSKVEENFEFNEIKILDNKIFGTEKGRKKVKNEISLFMKNKIANLSDKEIVNYFNMIRITILEESINEKIKNRIYEYEENILKETDEEKRKKVIREFKL